MSQKNQGSRGGAVTALALATASYLVLQRSGPIVHQGEIDTVPALAACLLVLSGAAVISAFFRFVARIFDFLEAKTPKGNKGTSGILKSLREIIDDLIKEGDGPYWGALNGIPIFADFVSNAMTVGPAGAGKGQCQVLPNLLFIRESKIWVDFKGELLTCTKLPLEARGEKVHALNYGGLYTDILGPSASYNFLDPIIDNFETPGGLADVTSDLTGFTKQLSPNPVKAEGGGENKYFLEGERDLIAYVINQNILVKHRRANLGDVSYMMNDVQALLREAEWVCGRARLKMPGSDEVITSIMPIENLPWVKNHDKEDVENFIEYHRGTAAALCDLIEATDSRTFDSFITGARQALRPFNKTTRAHKVSQKSSFRVYECKEGENATNVAVIVDASRIEAQIACPRALFVLRHDRD